MNKNNEIISVNLQFVETYNQIFFELVKFITYWKVYTNSSMHFILVKVIWDKTKFTKFEKSS